VLAEVGQRVVLADLGFRDTAGLVSSVLRINRTEARHRVAAAEDLGPRRGLTGELLPAVFPRVAAAQAVGTVSPEHARIIRATVQALPPAARAEHGAAVEATLTEQAAEFAPVELARLADVVAAALDPDGRLTRLCGLASQGKMLPVVLNNAGGILAFGRERRLASRGQRLAPTARDRGCTLTCHRTAAQSEIHHILD
jgi:hypothetical protein